MGYNYQDASRESQQEYFGRANVSRMNIEEREKTILLQKLSDREKRIAELKADLNEKENTVHTLDVLHKEAVRKYGEVNEQLTKAKEIIRWFVVYEKGEGIITNYNNFLEQAENFLKE